MPARIIAVQFALELIQLLLEDNRSLSRHCRKHELPVTQEGLGCTLECGRAFHTTAANTNSLSLNKNLAAYWGAYA